MIVKNESKIIERLLISVKPIIDCYCIHDTGSTDNTIECIQRFSMQHGIPGKIVQKPFVNFAVNRTAALVDAKPMAAFILLLDADMQLVIDPNFTKFLLETADVFRVQQGNDGFKYSNTRVIRSSVAVDYCGVTHEYINTAAGARTADMKHLKINDIGDGGSKADKFDRDIRLLTQGLIDEPNNARYYFYLANTYNDTRQWQKAIPAYMRRVELGGWDEEVFYSLYRIAGAFRELKDEDNFVKFSIKAWLHRPSRIESIHDLVKYFREKGKHPQACGLYHMVKSTPLSEDALFVHANCYTHGLDEEYVLSAFYANEKNAHLAYKRLFESRSTNLYSQLQTYKFYKPILTGKRLDFSCEHQVTIDGKSHMVHGSTPSILAIEDGYLMNVRLVNYTIDRTGGYDFPHSTVVTANKRVELDEDFGVRSELLLTAGCVTRCPSGWGTNLLYGIEDVKLAKRDDEIVFTGTIARSDGRIGMCYGRYQHALKPIELDMMASCEKNWVFTPAGEIIYSWHPLQYGTLVEPTLQLTGKKDMPRLFELARGSTNGVEHENEFWFVVHFVHKEGNEPRFYYHSVVVLDKDMNLVKYTYPFKFQDVPIEYCLGLLVQPGRLVFTHSANDTKSALTIVSRSDIDAIWLC